MPTRSYRPYRVVCSELDEANWLLRQARARIEALEACQPDDLAVREALNYADGLGSDSAPVRILARAVRGLMQEQRLAKRTEAELRRRLATYENVAEVP